MTDVGGIRATPTAIAPMQETGTEPGELAARYCEDCARVGDIRLIGYFLDEKKEPHGSGTVYVVLDPETYGVTIYKEFYRSKHQKVATELETTPLLPYGWLERDFYTRNPVTMPVGDRTDIR